MQQFTQASGFMAAAALPVALLGHRLKKHSMSRGPEILESRLGYRNKGSGFCKQSNQEIFWVGSKNRPTDCISGLLLKFGGLSGSIVIVLN